MKKFLLHICYGLTAVLIFFFAMDKYITNSLYSSDALIYWNWNKVIQDTTNYDLLLTGSSRTWVFYDPHIMDSVLDMNCYNLGMDAHGISTQVPRYYVYLESHPKPRYVVQNIDFGTLKATNAYLPEQFLPFLHYDSLFLQTHKEGVFTYADRYVPFIRYIGHRDVLFEALGLSNDLVRSDGLYKGYRAFDSHWNDCNNIDSLKFNCEESSKQIFEEYLYRMDKDSVKVILVYGPIYRGNLGKKASSEEESMCTYYEDCARKYNCHILNYLRHPICADTAYFYNVLHVNRIGSQIISQQLAHDVDSIINGCDGLRE